MRISKYILTLISALVVGCETIENARDKQEQLEGKAQIGGREAIGGKLDLRGYTLRQLVDFAMTNRPSVKAAALAVKDARLAMKQIAADAPVISETPWNAPKMSLTGAYSESSQGEHYSDFKLETEKGNPSATLSLELLIWDFGRHDATVRSQAEKTVAVELELIDEGFTVFNEVSEAYFNLLEKGALMEVAYTNQSEYALHLEQAERRHEAGDVKKLDVLRAKLDLAQAKEKTVNAENEVKVAGVELMRALGVDAGAGTREETMDFSMNALSFVLKGFPETDYKVGEAYELARTNSPAMQVARANLRSASAEVDYAIAELMPEVSVTASLSWVDPLWYFSWGGKVVQSVFQGFRKTTAVDRAVVAMEQAAEAVDSAEQRLSVNLENAIVARDDAKHAGKTAAESYNRAWENLELVKRQYEVGDVSRVDMTDAVADFTESMGNKISAFYKGQRAEAALYALIGRYPVYEEKKIEEELKH